MGGVETKVAAPGLAGMADLDVEVLIVGGGMVGATLACALAGAGIAAVAVDRDDPVRWAALEFDGRASAIARASQRVLAALGLWADMAPHAAPILDIRVTDGASPLFLHYDHRAVDGAPLGYILENRHYRRALARRLPALDDGALIAPAEIVALERGPARVQAQLADGRRVRAALAVACDGRESPTRRDADIRVTRWAYDQTAIVCTVAHERPHRGIAQEHFLPAGPFAILPLPDGAGPIPDPAAPGLPPHRSSIVWTERPALVDPLLALDENGFMAELEKRFGDYLGALAPVGPRWTHPLSLSHAATYIAPRLALAGDAAHGMHPIAGQGLNMGLRDVAALAEVLVDARRLGLDIGSTAVLERYQRWRRFDTVLMLAMTDGLNRLFSNRIAPLRLARDLGLAAVNRLPATKRIFMRHAMGLVGELPRLARGEPL